MLIIFFRTYSQKKKSPKVSNIMIKFNICIFYGIGSTGMEAFYWCPNPNSVDRSKWNLFPGGFNSIGQCYDYLKPPCKLSLNMIPVNARIQLISRIWSSLCLTRLNLLMVVWF